MIPYAGDCGPASDREGEWCEPCDCCEECPECLCHAEQEEISALREELGIALSSDCPF